MQNQANSAMSKIIVKINPTHVRDHLSHPVQSCEPIMCFISILKLSYIFPKDIISQNEHNFHLFGVVDECGAVLGSLPPGDGVVEGRVRGVAAILREILGLFISASRMAIIAFK